MSDEMRRVSNANAAVWMAVAAYREEIPSDTARALVAAGQVSGVASIWVARANGDPKVNLDPPTRVVRDHEAFVASGGWELAGAEMVELTLDSGPAAAPSPLVFGEALQQYGQALESGDEKAALVAVGQLAGVIAMLDAWDVGAELSLESAATILDDHRAYVAEIGAAKVPPQD